MKASTAIRPPPSSARWSCLWRRGGPNRKAARRASRGARAGTANSRDSRRVAASSPSSPLNVAALRGRPSMLYRILAIAALAVLPLQAHAFCGFYVGKADSSLFNEASAVILARDGKRTTLSMQNDYRGEPTEFALVVPVPVVLKQGDVRIVDKKIFDR